MSVQEVLGAHSALGAHRYVTVAEFVIRDFVNATMALLELPARSSAQPTIRPRLVQDMEDAISRDAASAKLDGLSDPQMTVPSNAKAVHPTRALLKVFV